MKIAPLQIFNLIELLSEEHNLLLGKVFQKYYKGENRISIRIYTESAVPDLVIKEWDWVENKYQAYAKSAEAQIKNIKKHIANIKKALKKTHEVSNPDIAMLRYLKMEFDLVSFQRTLELNNKSIINAAENFKPFFNGLGKHQIKSEYFFEKQGDSWINSKQGRGFFNSSLLSIEISENINESLAEVQVHIYLGPKARRSYATYWHKQDGAWECMMNKLVALS
jgi:hypothetical protein